MKFRIELTLVANKRRVLLGIIETNVDVKNAAQIAAQEPEHLTPREVQVRDLMLEGKVHKEIAAALNISESAVKQHAGGVYQKYAVRDRSALVAKLKGLRK